MMAAFNRKRARVMHKISLAAILCAVTTGVLLLLCSSNHIRILPRATYDSRSQLGLHLQHNYLITNTTAMTRDETSSINIARSESRQLSLSLDLQSCPKVDHPRPPPELPSIPNLLRTSTYAASFPGSGYKLITKHLVESITGMLVGEASTSPSLERMKVQKMDRTGFARGQEEVIVLRTSFPHTAGKLSVWDDFLPRAFVLLRNPLNAIPCYFDQLYRRKSHMPAGRSFSANEELQEKNAAWIKWRDDEFSNQLLLYARFVSFWMEKYLGRDDDRVYFSYESLVDEEEGSREAVRLAIFLQAGVRANVMEIISSASGLVRHDSFEGASFNEEALKSFVDVSEVPCVWKNIIHATISNGTTAVERSTMEEANGDFRSSAERPLTPENLEEISGMLLETMNRWSSHRRLKSILEEYHREVNLERNTVWRAMEN